MAPEDNAGIQNTQVDIQALLSVTPDLVYVYDLVERRNVYANRLLSDFIGYSAEDVAELGDSFIVTVIHPEDLQRVQDHHTRLRKSGLGYQATIEYRVRHKDQEYRWLESRDLAYSRDDDGSVRSILGVCRDVTERKQMLAQLEKREALYRMLTECSRELVCRHTLDGTYTYVSPSSEELVGYPPQALVGRNPYEFFHPSDQEKIRAQSHQPAQTGAHVNGVTYRFRHARGHYIWLETLARTTEAVTGAPDGLVTTSRDVTDRTMVLERLKQSNDELANFAHVASHDLQAPLRTMRGYVELFTEDYGESIDVEGRALLQEMQGSVARMQDLVTSLLAYATAGGAMIELEPVSIRSVIDDALVDLKHAIEDADATVDVDDEADNLMVLAADALLRQVFLNLLSNALKYRADRPLKIRIHIKQCRSEHVCVEVSDNGIGFPSDKAEAIFSVFHRLHTRDAYPGTGIGLSIVRRIVDRHGGRVFGRGQTGEGATFVVELPTPERKGVTIP